MPLNWPTLHPVRLNLHSRQAKSGTLCSCGAAQNSRAAQSSRASQLRIEQSEVNAQIVAMSRNNAHAGQTCLEQCVVAVEDEGEVLEPADPVWDVLDKESCYLPNNKSSLDM